MTWVAFLALAAIILLAGIQVATFGDAIAEKTGLGRTWIGVVLLASVTSLPEAISGISAVAIFDVPDIAVGGIVGSCTFNLLIIALLDATSRTSPLFSRVSQGHILSATFGIVLIGGVVVAILGGTSIPTLGWVSLASLAMVAVYFLAMRTIFDYERRQSIAPEQQHRYDHISARQAYLRFGFNALVIIIAATFLPGTGEAIAEQTGLEQTVVGTIFIALSTSLPEAVVAVTAIRIGAADLALGGLLGSNLFNIGILGVDDLFYNKGSIYLDVASTPAITAALAVLMSAIVVIGLMLRPASKLPYLAWDAVAIIAVYGVGTALVVTMG